MPDWGTIAPDPPKAKSRWDEIAPSEPVPDEPGTIDPLAPRKVLKNPDGTISTTSSASFEEDGKEVLIPTVVDGVRLSNADAWAHYKATGQHFGKFKDAASADTYASRMHDRQTDAMGLPRGNAPADDSGPGRYTPESGYGDPGFWERLQGQPQANALSAGLLQAHAVTTRAGEIVGDKKYMNSLYGAQEASRMDPAHVPTARKIVTDRAELVADYERHNRDLLAKENFTKAGARGSLPAQLSFGALEPLIEGDADPIHREALELNAAMAGTWQNLAATGIGLATSLPGLMLGAKTIGPTATFGLQGASAAAARGDNPLAGALEGVAFQRLTGGIAGRLAGEAPSALRAGAAEAGGVLGAQAAISTVKGEKVDWAGDSLQALLFGAMRAAGMPVASKEAKAAAVERAQALHEAVPDATPEQVAREIARGMAEGQKTRLEASAGQEPATAAERSLDPGQRSRWDEIAPKAQAADVAERKATGPSLSQYVRAEGGIDYRTEKATGGMTGELDRLRKKGSGTTGLVRVDGKGVPLDQMRQAAIHEGYLPEDATISDFLDAVEMDATGRGRTLSSNTTDFEAKADAEFRKASYDLAERLAIEDERGDASFAPTPGASERGAVGGPLPPESIKRSKVRDFIDSMRQRQLQNTRRANPEAQDAALTSLAAPIAGPIEAHALRKIIEPKLGPDISWDEYSDAVHEITFRHRGADETLVGVPGSTIPDEATFQAIKSDPHFADATKADAAFVNSRVEDYYKAGGGKKASFGIAPDLGYHHSLMPYGEESVTAGAGKRVLTPEGVVKGSGKAGIPPTQAKPGLSRIANPKAKTARQYTGGAAGYELDLETVRARQIAEALQAGGRKLYWKRLVESGDASRKWVADLKGEPTDYIPINPLSPSEAPKGIYVRRSLTPEARRVVRADAEPDDVLSGLGAGMTALNVTINPLELTTHLSGAAKAIAGAPSDFLHPVAEAVVNLIPGLGMNVPGVGRLLPGGGGSLLRYVKAVRAMKVIMSPPPEETLRLSAEVPGTLRRVTGGTSIGERTNDLIASAWNGAAVYLNRVYDFQVKRGGAVDTPDARRNFILGNLGNYFAPTRGTGQKALLSYADRFATAKVTRLTKGVETMLTGTGIPTASLGGFAKQRAMGATQLAGVITSAYVAWWLLTGKPPPEDVPAGGAPPLSGPLEVDGKTQFHDLANETLARRGAKSLGLDAAATAKRGGLTDDQAVGAGVRQLAERAGSVFTGPLIDATRGTLTGKDATGKRFEGMPFVSDTEKDPTGKQYALNALWSFTEQNPLLKAGRGLVAGTATGAEKGLDRMNPLASEAGKGEAYMEKLPAIRAKQDAASFKDYAFRRMMQARQDGEDMDKVLEEIRKEGEAIRARFQEAPK